MDEHTLKVLEFERLLDLLAGHALSGPGRVFCRCLQPDLDHEQAEQSWRVIDEARKIIELEGKPPLAELPDVFPVLDCLGPEGLVLKPRDLLQIGRAIRTSRLVKGFLFAQAERAPLLFEIVGALPVFADLEQAIDNSLGAEGEVLDTASPELARIRRELTGLRGAIQSHLTALMRTRTAQAALQDDIITRRSGRYVIPLRSSSRNQVPGLVHDVSASGATAFVEPLEVIEDNNRLNLLRSGERREVERVLKRLSALTAGSAHEIADAANLLAEVDSFFARAALSRGQKAVAPLLDLEGGLDVRQARHPLIVPREPGGDRTVPVDLRLAPESRVLIISGVNAGGKTVALKTLGLLVLMARTGLHLPVAEDSRLPFFDRILAVIGDEQDLQSDLSTFSGHVQRLTWVLDRATDRSLVLLDELGTGTDPAEGAALALAVLEELKARRAWVATATHYYLLKAWAHSTEGVANAAVMTNTSGRPVFGLEYGAPGFSAGLAMARDLGLSPDLVLRAETYLDEGQKKTLALMKRLEEERAALAQTKAETEALQEELVAAMARTSTVESDRAASWEEEMESLRTRVKEAISRAEMEFREVGRRMKEAGTSKGRLISEFHQAKARLKQAVSETRPFAAPILGLQPGDRVHLRSLGREGQVKAVDEARGRAEIEVSGIKVRTDWRDLARTGHAEEKEEVGARISLTTFTSVPRELNLIGLTVDETLPLVDKALDQAQVGGVKKFSIIHGIGAGRLREAVRGYLRHDSRVRAFHPGARRAGGEGVTVIELFE